MKKWEKQNGSGSGYGYSLSVHFNAQLESTPMAHAATRTPTLTCKIWVWNGRSVDQSINRQSINGWQHHKRRPNDDGTEKLEKHCENQNDSKTLQNDLKRIRNCSKSYYMFSDGPISALFYFGLIISINMEFYVHALLLHLSVHRHRERNQHCGECWMHNSSRACQRCQFSEDGQTAT